MELHNCCAQFGIFITHFCRIKKKKHSSSSQSTLCIIVIRASLPLSLTSAIFCRVSTCTLAQWKTRNQQRMIFGNIFAQVTVVFSSCAKESRRNEQNLKRNFRVKMNDQGKNMNNPNITIVQLQHNSHSNFHIIHPLTT